MSAQGIAGMVVLFHPDDLVIGNVSTYLSDLDALFVVDNTPEPDAALVESLRALPRVTYLPMGDNEGIARALNVGAQAARRLGYEFLLTMDQDSRAFGGMVSSLARVMEREPRAGLISASQLNERLGSGYDEVNTAITSGSLLRLAAWEDVGPFFESLFIDLVDDEYCLRLAVAGYRVIKCYEALLLHRLGDWQQHRWFVIGRVGSPNHSALRRYYIARNTAIVGDLYKDRFAQWWATQRILRARELQLVALFERDRLRKLAMARRGMRDARASILGRYPDRLHEASAEIEEVRSTGKLTFRD